jgi:hypothetical protein
MPDTAVKPSKGATAPATERAGIRLGIFVGGLVLALVSGFALGRVVSPTSPTDGAKTGTPMAGMDMSAAPHAHAPGASAGSEVGGLPISSGGYTMVPATTVFAKPGEQKLSFVIKGADGKPVTTFTTVHEKQLHFIVVRRDLTGYQHLHPTMAADGTWMVSAKLDAAGPWRAYADFTALAAAGTQTALALGTDLTVRGDYDPAALPASARESTVDGYVVTYEGTPTVGATAPLLFRVMRNGAPVTLQPYLGSFGHLVVLRDLDLGYVHVHPEPALADGAVKLWLAAPSRGSYRMFFDFSVDGKVHTATFTLVLK